MQTSIRFNWLGAPLLVLSAACSSGPSLNPYQGPLKDLFPENAAEFKRVSSDLITRDMRQYSLLQRIGANSGLIAVYESSSSKAAVTAWNFPSADNALGALNLLKLDFKDRVTEDGPENKGNKEVGARFIGDPDPSHAGRPKLDLVITTPSSPQNNQTP